MIISSRFKLGQRVTYLTICKEGVIVQVDAGLGYYVLHDGWVYSVPEDSLSAKIGKRYKTSRKRPTLQKSQVKKPNDFESKLTEEITDFNSEPIESPLVNTGPSQCRTSSSKGNLIDSKTLESLMLTESPEPIQMLDNEEKGGAE